MTSHSDHSQPPQSISIPISQHPLSDMQTDIQTNTTDTATTNGIDRKQVSFTFTGSVSKTKVVVENSGEKIEGGENVTHYVSLLKPGDLEAEAEESDKNNPIIIPCPKNTIQLKNSQIYQTNH